MFLVLVLCLTTTLGSPHIAHIISVNNSNAQNTIITTGIKQGIKHNNKNPIIQQMIVAKDAKASPSIESILSSITLNVESITMPIDLRKLIISISFH